MANATRVWAREDIPVLDDAAQYLGVVQAIRNVFPALPGLPEVPQSMDHLTYQKANDIEAILAQIGRTLDAIPQSRVYSGEFQSGGV